MRQLWILGLGFSLLLGGCAPQEWRPSGEPPESEEPAAIDVRRTQQRRDGDVCTAGSALGTRRRANHQHHRLGMGKAFHKFLERRVRRRLPVSPGACVRAEVDGVVVRAQEPHRAGLIIIAGFGCRLASLIQQQCVGRIARRGTDLCLV